MIALADNAEASVALRQHYLPLVRRIAMRTIRRLPPAVSFDDLVGAGCLGLAEVLPHAAGMAADKFTAYASYRIQGAMLDYLRSLDPLTRKRRAASRHVEATMRSLAARLGRLPEEAEVAQELGLELEAYGALMGTIGEVQPTNLDLVPVASPDEERPDRIAIDRELVGSLFDAIAKLPDEQRLVMALRHGEDCSYREIAEVLEVTESRVCQIHTAAVHRLRAMLRSNDEPPSSGVSPAAVRTTMARAS